MGRLTTHVLDTMRGLPASGMRIILEREADDRAGAPTLIVDLATNADGRTDQPLLAAEQFRIGRYRLSFFVAEYFRASGVHLAEPAFLDVVPITFGISDEEAHLHVPLLVSPYAYSTYRGS